MSEAQIEGAVLRRFLSELKSHPEIDKIVLDVFVFEWLSKGCNAIRTKPPDEAMAILNMIFNIGYELGKGHYSEGKNFEEFENMVKSITTTVIREQMHNLIRNDEERLEIDSGS